MNLVVSVLLGLALVLVGLRVMEPRLVYYPFRQIEVTPDRLGLSYRDIYLTTADGVRINGWWLPAGGTWAVLFLHGNGGNISYSLDKLALLHQLGADALVIDYRGYGRSEGTPDEPGTYRDADAAYDYLVQERRIATDRLVVYGESLGAAVAVDLASRRPVAGVVVNAGFTSAADLGQTAFPFLPVRWVMQNKYDALSRIDRIRAPLLILHSRDDEIVPFRHARRLLDKALPPKRLVELRGGHNEAFLESGEAYREALKAFFESLPGASP